MLALPFHEQFVLPPLVTGVGITFVWEWLCSSKISQNSWILSLGWTFFVLGVKHGFASCIERKCDKMLNSCQLLGIS